MKTIVLQNPSSPTGLNKSKVTFWIIPADHPLHYAHMDLLPQSLLIVLMQFISLGVLAYSAHFIHRYSRMTATDARSATLIGTISILYGIWLLNMGTADPNTRSLNFVFPMFPTLVGFTLAVLPFSLGLALAVLGYHKSTQARKSEPGLRLQTTENVSDTEFGH